MLRYVRQNAGALYSVENALEVNWKVCVLQIVLVLLVKLLGWEKSPTLFRCFLTFTAAAFCSKGCPKCTKIHHYRKHTNIYSRQNLNIRLHMVLFMYFSKSGKILQNLGVDLR